MGGGIVNHCVILSRDGERQLLGVSVLVKGGGKEFERGEKRAASLCSKVRAQRDPMNIWSSAADCVWALSPHNVSFEGHLALNAGQS